VTVVANICERKGLRACYFLTQVIGVVKWRLMDHRVEKEKTGTDHRRKLSVTGPESQPFKAARQNLNMFGYAMQDGFVVKLF
jgi:hypothetical protein